MAILPDTNISYYEGKYSFDFSCVGETKCNYALCCVMPPTGEDNCMHKQYGNCKSKTVQLQVINVIRKKLSTVAKSLDKAQWMADEEDEDCFE